MDFIVVINFRDCSSWWQLNPAFSCHLPGAPWRKIKYGKSLILFNTKSASLKEVQKQSRHGWKTVHFCAFKLWKCGVWAGGFACIWVYIGLDPGNYYFHFHYYLSRRFPLKSSTQSNFLRRLERERESCDLSAFSFWFIKHQVLLTSFTSFKKSSFALIWNKMAGDGNPY